MSKFKDLWKNSKIEKSVAPRLFSMVRNADESGTSGTGHVLDGVVFPSGKCVICWDPESARVMGVNSISIFDSYEAFESIHIGQHPANGTVVEFLN